MDVDFNKEQLMIIGAATSIFICLFTAVGFIIGLIFNLVLKVFIIMGCLCTKMSKNKVKDNRKFSFTQEEINAKTNKQQKSKSKKHNKNKTNCQEPFDVEDNAEVVVGNVTKNSNQSNLRQRTTMVNPYQDTYVTTEVSMTQEKERRIRHHQNIQQKAKLQTEEITYKNYISTNEGTKTTSYYNESFVIDKNDIKPKKYDNHGISYDGNESIKPNRAVNVIKSTEIQDTSRSSVAESKPQLDKLDIKITNILSLSEEIQNNSKIKQTYQPEQKGSLFGAINKEISQNNNLDNQITANTHLEEEFPHNTQKNKSVYTENVLRERATSSRLLAGDFNTEISLNVIENNEVTTKRSLEKDVPNISKKNKVNHTECIIIDQKGSPKSLVSGFNDDTVNTLDNEMKANTDKEFTYHVKKDKADHSENLVIVPVTNTESDVINLSDQEKYMLKQINDISAKGESLQKEIEDFHETSKSNTYSYIDEMLFRYINKLDRIEVGKNTILVRERRHVIKYLNSLFKKLDEKANANSSTNSNNNIISLSTDKDVCLITQ